ncbi:MAG: hypothetical protein V4553_19700 [Bacteroidota bacterium]
MKPKHILLIIALLAVSKSSFAQYAKDAIRFSTGQTGSTSRIKAIGNANTAIGGDLTNISGNPAGLGYFTRSEASLTPEFDSHTSNAGYLGQSSAATKGNPNINNAGIVFYTRLNTPSGDDKTHGWVSVNIGLNYNRTNNFDERVNYGGKNNNNSINDYYANLANAEGTDAGTLQGWAYDQKLISPFSTASNYKFASNSYLGVQQLGYINRTGGQSGSDISVGANYSNKLYLGFGLGIATLRYNSTKTFTETGTASISENGAPVNRGFNSTYSQFQTTKGEGFNFKLGAIYKVVEAVRFGAVITTPTFLTIDDSFSEGLTNSLSNGSNFANGPIEYPLSYTMRTPFKAAGGISIFAGQYGFITGDVEYVDYSGTRINSNDDYTNSYDNNIIKTTYRSAVNLRAGAELKLGSVALRGGYGIQPSPLKTGGADTKTVSGGLGYRLGSYYVDAAYMHIKGSRTELPYNINLPTNPVADISQTNNNFFFTVGFRY